jgi:hypothetical protein
MERRKHFLCASVSLCVLLTSGGGVNNLGMNYVVTFALVMKNYYVYHDC